MPALWQSPAHWVAMLVALVGTTLIGFLPLFGGPGYEAALAAGLLLPATAACATAAEICRTSAPTLTVVGRGALAGAVLAAIGLGVTLAHGARVGFCDAWEGIAFFALGPGVGAVLGGVWGSVVGTCVGLLGRGRLLAVILALAGPVGGVALSLWRFYTSPMVFAFDPFAGYFAGTLYDTVISGLDRLATYRAGSLATLVAVVVGFAHLRNGRELRVAIEPRHPALTALGMAAAIGSMAHAAYGPELGHYQTTATIRAALGHQATSRRCDLIYPGSVSKRDAHALARECDAHVAQLETFFNVEAPPRTTVFVFESAEQKGRLMGAAHVFIAKPWRDEIYIQGAGYPHRVLRHELAHVVAGRFARGPFRVAGPLHGLIPDPGRIEGVAVAAAPAEDDLSLSEWAAAMRKLELLPPLDRVFKLSFLGEPSSRAYTVAGAFVEWFKDEIGTDALKRWYGGEPIEAVSGGKGLAGLEREWHQALDGVRISDQAMRVAEERFDRTPVFERRCPHVVDRLTQHARWALGRSDVDEAREGFDDVLALDPHSASARMGLAACAARAGEAGKAVEAYRRVADDDKLPRAVRASAVEEIADMRLAEGRNAEAKKLYDEVAESVVDEDHLRALDVKRYAATHADGHDAIVNYLVGDPKLGRDETIAAEGLGAWVERDPKLGLAEYLLARHLLNRGRWEAAAQHLDRARDKRLPLASVRREATRSRLVLACALGDPVGVRTLWKELAADRDLPSATRTYLEQLVGRCTRADTSK